MNFIQDLFLILSPHIQDIYSQTTQDRMLETTGFPVNDLLLDY